MKRITKEMKERVLKSTRWICPFCGKLTFSDSHYEGVKIMSTTEVCDSCGGMYDRIYRLVDIKGGRQ